MTIEDVYAQISPLAMQVLKIDHFDSTVTMNSTEEWDSLSHVRLLSAIERQFPIEIGAEDAYRLTTADRLVRYVHGALEANQ
jgi:acyl carrier protein